jgi:hypothetical protein
MLAAVTNYTCPTLSPTINQPVCSERNLRINQCDAIDQREIAATLLIPAALTLTTGILVCLNKDFRRPSRAQLLAHWIEPNSARACQNPYHQTKPTKNTRTFSYRSMSHFKRNSK